MAPPVRALGDVLFGGRTRAAVLGYLAASKSGATGYAMAKGLGIGVSKVYPELSRLEGVGLLGCRQTAKGAKAYFLKDEDLRRFLVRRVFTITMEAWFSAEGVAERRAAMRSAQKIPFEVRPGGAAKGKRPFAKEFRRPAGKDLALRRFRRTSDKGG